MENRKVCWILWKIQRKKLFNLKNEPFLSAIWINLPIFRQSRTLQIWPNYTEAYKWSCHVIFDFNFDSVLRILCSRKTLVKVISGNSAIAIMHNITYILFSYFSNLPIKESSNDLLSTRWPSKLTSWFSINLQSSLREHVRPC